MIIFAQLIETANEGESELIEAIEAFHNKEDMLSTMSQVFIWFPRTLKHDRVKALY